MTDTPEGDPRDYVLDLSSMPPASPAGPAAPPAAPSPTPPAAPRDTLSIHFRCCNTYARIRLTADASAYAGHCPKCARPIRVDIDPDSPNTGRIFTAE